MRIPGRNYPLSRRGPPRSAHMVAAPPAQVSDSMACHGETAQHYANRVREQFEVGRVVCCAATTPGPSPRGGPPKKGLITKLFIFLNFFWGTFFPKKLGLDAILESWDLKIRIPRRKLRIWSYSQVETRQFRSKYLQISCLICFFS